MSYDKKLIAHKLRRWEKYLAEYRLPRWEEIPDLGLYMEQVTVLIRQYLDYLPPELKGDQVITASTVNNYVRTKVMPEPRRKKYYRVHIAYLIMICTLKQSLSIATLQKMIPIGLEDEQVHELYDTYVQRHHFAAAYFIDQVRIFAAKILDHEEITPAAVDDPRDLISNCAIISGFSKLLADKLLPLDGLTLEDVVVSEEAHDKEKGR